MDLYSGRIYRGLSHFIFFGFDNMLCVRACMYHFIYDRSKKTANIFTQNAHFLKYKTTCNYSDKRISDFFFLTDFKERLLLARFPDFL